MHQGLFIQRDGIKCWCRPRVAARNGGLGGEGVVAPESHVTTLPQQPKRGSPSSSGVRFFSNKSRKKFTIQGDGNDRRRETRKYGSAN